VLSAARALTPNDIMIRDFQQIQGGRQISNFSFHLLASLNLLETNSVFTEPDAVKQSS